MSNNTTSYAQAEAVQGSVASGVVTGIGPYTTIVEYSQGTFTCNGTTAVTITDPAIVTTSIIDISLNTVGGTVGAIPAVKTITSGSCTVAGTASDTSVYNYVVQNLGKTSTLGGV